jgi:hypothetical protein
MPCPDDASRPRNADYPVFGASRSALGARDQLVGVYTGVFTRAFAHVKASP